jgi:outer membrane protein assembly factor BamD
MNNRRWNRISILIILALLLSLLQCAGSQNEILSGAADYYDRGVRNFENKKWDKAIEDFSMVVLNSPGGELADDAQFYLGECHFKKKEYLLAIAEYQQLVERYSYSPLVEDAFYKIAFSYFELSPKYQLDQGYTEQALSYLQDFIDTFPNSKYRKEAEEKIQQIRYKLAKKMYESGRLYMKLHEWESANIYFDSLLEQYYDMPLAIEAQLGKAYCLIKLRKFDEYQAVISEVKNNELTREIEAELKELDALYKDELEEIEKEKEKRSW